MLDVGLACDVLRANHLLDLIKNRVVILEEKRQIRAYMNAPLVLLIEDRTPEFFANRGILGGLRISSLLTLVMDLHLFRESILAISARQNSHRMHRLHSGVLLKLNCGQGQSVAQTLDSVDFIPENARSPDSFGRLKSLDLHRIRPIVPATFHDGLRNNAWNSPAADHDLEAHCLRAQMARSVIANAGARSALKSAEKRDCSE